MTNFLYNTILGRIILKLLTLRFISRIVGKYMDSSLSKGRISKFIRNNGIDMSDYAVREYSSFNDFFTRELKEGAREICTDKDALVSPCDGLLSVYNIGDDMDIRIKDSRYTAEELLANRELAEKYRGGKMLVFRLTVTDYHRYMYFDNGTKEDNVFIQGIFHTVQPIAQTRYKIYKTNSREYTILHTENFGDVVQMEVGAMMVGRICNSHGKYTFSRGEEKGKFEFGGSTIVLLLEKGKAEVFEEYVPDSFTEVPVKLGQKIGVKSL